MITALIDAQGIVVNIIKLEPDSDYQPDKAFTLVEATEQVCLGGTYDGVNFHNPPLPPGLTSDKTNISANAIDAATITYRHNSDIAIPATVTFTVNGVVKSIDLIDLVAQVAVTIAAPGPIDISVNTLANVVLIIEGV